VLSGTRLGYYKCPDKGYSLKDLLSGIFSIDGNYRIRFSSIGPMEISESFVKFLKGAGRKFCDHFHLSIQSASNKVLKDMKRGYDKSFILELLRIIRGYFPQSGIFCDIIAAFPTETDRDFEETCDFLIENNISGLHVFTYSKRPKVEAEKYQDLPKELKNLRSEKLREIDVKLRIKFADFLSGKKLEILTLKKKGENIYGLSSINTFKNVLIEGYSNKYLIGKLC